VNPAGTSWSSRGSTCLKRALLAVEDVGVLLRAFAGEDLP
jgi:hypothetical protein